MRGLGCQAVNSKATIDQFRPLRLPAQSRYDLYPLDTICSAHYALKILRHMTGV